MTKILWVVTLLTVAMVTVSFGQFRSLENGINKAESGYNSVKNSAKRVKDVFSRKNKKGDPIKKETPKAEKAEKAENCGCAAFPVFEEKQPPPVFKEKYNSYEHSHAVRMPNGEVVIIEVRAPATRQRRVKSADTQARLPF